MFYSQCRSFHFRDFSPACLTFILNDGKKCWKISENKADREKNAEDGAKSAVGIGLAFSEKVIKINERRFFRSADGEARKTEGKIRAGPQNITR